MGKRTASARRSSKERSRGGASSAARSVVDPHGSAAGQRHADAQHLTGREVAMAVGGAAVDLDEDHDLLFGPPWLLPSPG